MSTVPKPSEKEARTSEAVERLN